jgi:hypothetical protein
VKAETKFLRHLSNSGYFESGSFDPQPVFQAARKFLQIDVASREENERLTMIINRWVEEGVIRFEYSKDPALHPKDVLDHWRLVLTPAGVAEIEDARKQR